jgi:hypothetical protein
MAKHSKKVEFAGKSIRKPMAPPKRVEESKRRKLREKAEKSDW